MSLSRETREALVQAGQEEALARLDALAGEARDQLAAALGALDVVRLIELRGLLRSNAGVEAARSFEPPELFQLERGPEEEGQAREAVARGQELLRAGKVGYVLVAGGQASRLGYDAPKGDYPIGPVTGRTLFAYHAQRLLAAQARHGKPTPWYVMTSPANDAATRAIFETNAFFGLDPADVFFFAQDMLPALDAEGRVLFSGRSELFLAPNGHGGCLLGLASSGALADMEGRGIEQISFFQVDNPLVRPADPLFLGLHAGAGAGMSTKVVRKRDAAEKVGVIGRVDGRMGCIEYSDLPPELREARDDAGELRFRAGNIAVHAIAVDFLRSMTSGGDLALPWHLARKGMQVVDAAGATVEVTGVKFETFVFDALGASESSVTMEVERALEFSPVKNREGEDSPASSRAALAELFAEWVRAAGSELPPPNAEGIHPVEVDPRFAETQDEFLARGNARPQIRPEGHLYAD
jgi:UDP-N-acetylglucosamine/UDP-N-acetylgalactosamine diphosphorylase